MQKTTVSLLSLLFLSTIAFAMDNLDVKFEWKQIDYDYPTPEARQDAIDTREFVPENNLPLGLEVYGDRLFVTVPRWKSGVAASLNYIKLSGKKKELKQNQNFGLPTLGRRQGSLSGRGERGVFSFNRPLSPLHTYTP